MPKYSYKCKECESELVFFHSMTDEKEDCEKCGKEQSLEKLPSQFTIKTKTVTGQIGDTVKNSIKNLKADLKDQKESLSNEFYSTNK